MQGEKKHVPSHPCEWYSYLHGGRFVWFSCRVKKTIHMDPMGLGNENHQVDSDWKKSIKKTYQIARSFGNETNLFLGGASLSVFLCKKSSN